MCVIVYVCACVYVCVDELFVFLSFVVFSLIFRYRVNGAAGVFRGHGAGHHHVCPCVRNIVRVCAHKGIILLGLLAIQLLPGK